MSEDKRRRETIHWMETYSADVAKKVRSIRLPETRQYPKFTCRDFDSDIDIVLHVREMDDRVHEQDYLEIIYVKSGYFHINIDNEVISISQDAFMLIGSYLPHSERADMGSEVYHILIRGDTIMQSFINLIVEAPGLASFFTSFILNPRGKHYMVFNFESDASIQQRFFNILTTFSEKGPQYLPILKCEIVLLLLCICRQFQEKKYKEPLISHIVEYIFSNYTSITLQQTAQHFNYHPDYLSKLLKREYGRSFQQILQTYRMQQAAILLEQTVLSVSDIALCIGYASTVGFQKSFQKEFGCTPGTYRMKHQKF